MARTIDYTIAYRIGGKTVDLFKIFFGGDGSYYVTAPYHPLNRAIAARMTVNYAKPEGQFRLTDSEDIAVLDDDDRRLKLSHHPDGFLQFSGQGVRSGRDEQGRPKGMGVHSWRLTNPAFGPSFQLGFSDALACGRASRGRTRTVIFDEEDIEHLRSGGIDGLSIVGYYLPVRWREFVYRTSDGSMRIDLVHPNTQAVKRLRVVLASKDSEIPGLVGLEALPHGLDAIDDQPSFFVTTSTGSLRRNIYGELVGDQLFCAYPPPDLDDAKYPSLNHPLPQPPYTAPPGTTEIFPPESE
ncbi:hypothetical protein [Modestobacter sp. KNN46-3]|jgi:hypothetical protein|uniref:hypothetical protein n=1 Tax=Modestobacter sp. KNN46-3 TaxID=2711218 RepID=UPI0013E0CE49|nr:hypothetical protein [Modestobacter sp. KNN46-3]